MADNVRGQMRGTREGGGGREGKPRKTGGDPKLSPKNRRKNREIRQKRAQKRYFTVVIQAVCEQYGISLADITGESRVRNIAEARMVAMTIGYAHTNMTLAEIGAVFHRTRNATLNAVYRITGLTEFDQALRDRVTCVLLGVEYLYTHPEYIRQDIVIV